MYRRGVAALWAILLTAAMAGAQTESQACSVPGQVVTQPDGWTRIRAPQFATGPQSLVGYAVDPASPERLFATNGKVLRLSTDGGCMWTTALSIPPNPTGDFPFPAATTMESVVIPARAASSGRFHYMVVREDHGGGVVRPGVLRSDDSGETWERTLLTEDAEPGELPLGDPVELVVPDTAPDTVYLAASARGRTLLYVSHDAGTGWRPAFVEGDELPPEFEASDVEVDPLDPERVWAAAGETRLWRSEDRGVEWEQVPESDAPAPISVVDVFRTPGISSRIWALGRPDLSFRSNDGGETWQQMPGMPGGLLKPDSAAHGASADDLFVLAAADGSGGWALGWSVAAGWQVLKQSAVPLRDATSDRAHPPSFYARTNDRIYRSPAYAAGFATPGFEGGLVPPAPPPPPVPPPPPSGVPCQIDADLGSLPEPPTLDDSRLSPSDIRLSLRAGESRVVPYALSMPGAAPVDLYFLIDASFSMEAALCGAANSSAEIAKTLVESGVDAWFGVGTYQDLPPSSTCYAYMRWVDVGPLDEDFWVPSRTCWGTAEPQMTSLVQAATGTGHPPWIASGQQASFREEAVPVIVHVSDEPLKRNGQDSPTRPPVEGHNTLEEAVEALRSKGIRQVGILPFGEGSSPILGDDFDEEVLGNPPPARVWLRRVARETDAIAAELVDCDGDGSVDIGPGEPLVCTAVDTGASTGIAMADAVSGMVLALRDEAPVKLVKTDPGKVVDDIEPEVHAAVNLRSDNLLPFDVTYTCLPEQAGQTFPVKLAAKVRDHLVATATAIVTCAGVPVPNVPPVVPPVVGLVAAPPPVPPPPPPVPPTVPAVGPAPAAAPGPAPQPQPNPQPNPQTNPQPNPQSQGQAQAAVAVQEQKQTQTALAQAANKIADREEYAMSANRRPRASVSTPLFLGVGALTLAYGCLRRTQLRTRRAEARHR